MKVLPPSKSREICAKCKRKKRKAIREQLAVGVACPEVGCNFKEEIEAALILENSRPTFTVKPTRQPSSKPTFKIKKAPESNQAQPSENDLKVQQNTLPKPEIKVKQPRKKSWIMRLFSGELW